jgi:hypothetical protein
MGDIEGGDIAHYLEIPSFSELIFNPELDSVKISFFICARNMRK